LTAGLWFLYHLRGGWATRLLPEPRWVNQAPVPVDPPLAKTAQREDLDGPLLLFIYLKSDIYI
jgi:hypothetical protein